MAELGYDWVAVCDGDDRLLGWIGAAELDGATAVGGLTPKPFLAVVTADTTLKAALDGIVTSRTRVAMAGGGGGRYLGVLLGAAVAFPLGLAGYRWRHSYPAILGVTSVLYTIPSLSLIVLLGLGFGLGLLNDKPLIIALAIYTLAILVDIALVLTRRVLTPWTPARAVR